MEFEDEGYRAIGRWFVEFARLIGGMRSNMETRLQKHDERPEVVQLVFGAATAQQIADAFFAMCRLVGDLDAAENNVATQLQNAIGKEITRRNNIAHGEWVLGQGLEPGIAQAYLVRVHPNRRKAPHHEVTTMTSKDLDERSDRLDSLSRLTYVFGMIVLGGPILTKNGVVPADTFRVSDVLVAENVPKNGKGGEVVMAGPKASLIL